MAFSEKLKALRLEHKLTQDELGEKLYLSRASISSYEIGRNEPTIETIIAISDLFNITTDELLKRGVNTMTNFEKIKSMSKEQMTHFMLDIMLDTLNNNVCGYCENCDAPCLENEEIIRKWLESEVEE